MRVATYKYTTILVNVKHFTALCGFYAKQNQLSLLLLAGVPVGGKSSVCLICMKYRILILIIIIKRPGEILLSYIANTSRTHSRTHPVLMYPSHSQHFIIDEIHLLSLTIFAQEALVTRNV